ncbi:MAG: hypothetical protein DMNBKLKJ_00107 [Candidatus Westeberhardia cardiocondylae]|nr:hypothetical protein [Candidatus Westeberhardia cardiocondylae]
MIYSVTAYAQYKIEKTWGKILWEIKSTKQNFLTIHIQLPKTFYNLKQKIQKTIYSKIFRGKIECNLFLINYYDNKKNEKLILNKKLAKKLTYFIQWIKKHNPEGTIDILKFLQWPGIITQKKEKNINTIYNILLISFNKTFNKFIQNKKKQGNKLKKKIQKHLYNIAKEITKINKTLPNLLITQKKILLNQIKIKNQHINNEKLEQEKIIFLQKINITKELNHLETHIQKIHNMILKTHTMNYQLNPILQKCTQEIHKITSKIFHIYIIKKSKKLKTLIKKMQKIIQHIE